MPKIAVFCPRFSEEPEEAWKLRRTACRDFLGRQQFAFAPDYERLEQLKLYHQKHAFEQVVIARSGYYSMAFHEWAALNRVMLIDALKPPAEPEQTPRHIPLPPAQRPPRATRTRWRETKASRFASE
jgi:hypothetical protein